MRSIGIANKILLSISILVFGYSLTIIHGVLNGVEIKDNLNKLSTNIFPASQLSQKALDLFEKEIEIYKEMLMTGDIQLTLKARESDTELIENMESLLEITPDGSLRNRIQDTFQNIKTFGKNAPEIYQEMEDASLDHAPDIVENAARLANQRNNIHRELLAYRDYFVNTMNANLTSTGECLQRQSTLNIIIFIAVLISSLSIIFFVLAKFIRIPLHHTIHAFKSGAMGDFSVRLNIRSKDEFGRMAHFFNDFMKKLQIYDHDLRNEIFEHQQSEEKLRKSEELYTKLVNTIPEVVIRTDLDGRILYVNEKAVKLSGFSREELVGKNILLFISSEDHDSTVRDLQNVEDMATPTREYKITIKDKRVLNFEISGDVLRNEEGEAFGRVYVGHDITEKKLAEKEKADLQNQLIQAQKMESIGRLAGGVAHDFNNMLSVIIGSVELAMMKTDNTIPIYTILQEILNAANRSADLTRQLLAFARKQTAKPESLDLNEAITVTSNMLKRLIGENIELIWCPGDALWPVYMDPAQIDQILTNLVVNSRDEIDPSGKITIKTANIVSEEPQLPEFPDCLPGEYVMISVSDDGAGMDKDTLNNIFEPFFTTKEKGRGTGLGLATVYGIVKQNKGFIRVHSEPGQGATFEVYLPKSLEEGLTTRQKYKPNFEKGGETILLVEDEAVVMDVTQQILESLGYDVITANTPMEAIHLARTHEGKIDLLMTDVIMPQMNGNELAKKIQEILPELRCLYTSGYTSEVISHHRILAKNVHFIAKPFNITLVSNKLQEIFNA